MRRFVVSVSDRAFERLSDLAEQRRRTIKDQAAWLLERQVLKIGDAALEMPGDVAPHGQMDVEEA